MEGYKITNPFTLLHRPLYIEQHNFNMIEKITFYQYDYDFISSGIYIVAVWKIKYKHENTSTNSYNCSKLHKEN